MPSGALKVGGKNRLQADCAGTDGEEAVHLAFSVNGQEVAKETDTQKPYTTGSVGFLVYAGPKAAAEAEFDNFAVTQH